MLLGCVQKKKSRRRRRKRRRRKSPAPCSRDNVLICCWGSWPRNIPPSLSLLRNLKSKVKCTSSVCVCSLAGSQNKLSLIYMLPEVGVSVRPQFVSAHWQGVRDKLSFICFLVILKSEVSVHPRFASAHWESKINVIRFIFSFLIILKSGKWTATVCVLPWTWSQREVNTQFSQILWSQIKGMSTVLCLPLTGKKCLVCTIPTTILMPVSASH